MKQLLLCLVLTLVSINCFSISNDAWLRKVSIQLTGAPASQEDMNEVRSLKQAEAKKFIANKIKDYQGTDSYQEKMRHRLDELFRVRISYHGETAKQEINQPAEYQGGGINTRSSSMDQLFLKIFKKNLSWDQLLLEKEYEVFSLSPNEGSDFGLQLSDLKYYSYLFDAQLKSTSDYLDKMEKEANKSGYALDPKDEKLKTKVKALTQNEKDALAGALTTSRFFSRYPTTKLNKNRKRAAAVFRIFLCDAMQPVVLTSKEENQKLLNLALNKKSLSPVSVAIADNKKHGDDPSCNACHYKLDPAAKTFNGSSLLVSKTISSGGLVYKKDDGTLVSVPVNGIGELGSAITQQDEYLQCQVNHFWNWFVGQDIPLTAEKKTSLAVKFDELGRKPNDFIQYLLTEDDYTNPILLTEDNINYSHIQPLFKRCDSCHTGDDQTPILSKGYPFATDKGMNEFAVGMLHIATSLDEDGRGYMPPKDAGWKLQGKDRDLLKAWVRNGAKDSAGNVMLSKKMIAFYKSKIKLSKEISPVLTASFEDTHKRYFENYDMMLTLNKIFGKTLEETCTSVYTKENSSKVGLLMTLNGKPLSKYASTSYLEYVQGCLYSTITADISSVGNEEDANKYVSSKLLEAMKTKSGASNKVISAISNIFGNNDFEQDWTKILKLKWSELDSNEKYDQIINLYNRFIGATVYPDGQRQALLQKTFGVTEQMLKEVGKDSLEQAIIWISFSILSSEEFLTF